MSKKYELIDSEYVFNVRGQKIFRILALVDIEFYGIKSGDKGGYVESEKNLDQSGNAWVSGKAQVHDNSKVCGSAQVHGNAKVHGSAMVSGNAKVSGNAWVQKRFESVNVTNLDWSLTSLPKGIQIGCQFLSLEEWKNQHIQIGLKNGLTEEQAKAYYKLMRAIRRIQRLEAKKQKNE